MDGWMDEVRSDREASIGILENLLRRPEEVERRRCTWMENKGSRKEVETLANRGDTLPILIVADTLD